MKLKRLVRNKGTTFEEFDVSSFFSLDRTTFSLGTRTSDEEESKVNIFHENQFHNYNTKGKKVESKCKETREGETREKVRRDHDH